MIIGDFIIKLARRIEKARYDKEIDISIGLLDKKLGGRWHYNKALCTFFDYRSPRKVWLYQLERTLELGE